MFLYTQRRTGGINIREVEIYPGNWVDGPEGVGTPLEDFAPYFTHDKKLDEEHAFEVLMRIYQLSDEGQAVDIDAIVHETSPSNTTSSSVSPRRVPSSRRKG